MHFFYRYCLVVGLLAVLPPVIPAQASTPATVKQAKYPEDEIARRRALINDRVHKIERSARARSGTVGTALVPIPKAIALRGRLIIHGGNTSTFYGKVRRQIDYTISERFLGNLIVTRYYDRNKKQYSDRKDYAMDTLSMEIDASDFNGKICSKYAGSPPACTNWLKLDLWQIADGEEYPGRKSNVVTASSAKNNVTLRIDGPDILFVPSKGKQWLRSGCGDAVQKRFTRDEFEQMLKKKKITLKKVLGKTRPSCDPGSTVSLEITLTP